MSDGRVPLLVVSDAVAATGFARVAHCILERLGDRYEIHHLGVNYAGDPHGAEWKIYPASLGGDVFGVGRLEGLIGKIKPRLVFMIYDLWILARFAPILARHRERLRSVMYFPVDGVPVEPSSVKALQAFDRWVAYTEFGASAMRAACAAAAREDAEIAEREIAIVPHGVERRYFHPLPGGRREARRALLPDAPDSSIPSSSSTPTATSRASASMSPWRASRSSPAPSRPASSSISTWDARMPAGMSCCSPSGSHRGAHDPDKPRAQRATETPERLNLIYNACDIGLNTASGEGWGLAAFEHAATGAAQIVPRHTACAELWEGAAEFVDPVATLITRRC